MDCKRLVAVMAFVLTVSGCVWAPGQHMRSNSLMGNSQQVAELF